MNLRERYRPVALASNVLVLTSFGVLVSLLLVNGGLSLVNLAIGSGVILVANLAFVASGMLAPGIAAPGKIVFPLNVTLPIIFSAWELVVAFITWRIGNPLEPTLQVFREFEILFKPMELALFPVAQFVALSLAAGTNSRSTPGAKVEAS